MKVVITDRGEDVHVSVEGRVGIWGCGPDVYSAIGKMLRDNPDFFDIEFVDKRTRRKKSKST